LVAKCRGNQLWAASGGVYVDTALVRRHMAEVHSHVWHLHQAWVTLGPFDDADARTTGGIVEANGVEFVV
jgi:hypothetical protein